MLGRLIYSKISFLQEIVKRIAKFCKIAIFLQISETWVPYQCSLGAAVVKLLFWHEKAWCRRCRDRSRDLGASWLCGLCKDQQCPWYSQWCCRVAPVQTELWWTGTAHQGPLQWLCCVQAWCTRRVVLIAASRVTSFCPDHHRAPGIVVLHGKR